MYRIIFLGTFLSCIAFSACEVQNILEEKATVGQSIVIPCGVKVKDTLERLVWKVGNVNNTEDLAFIYQGGRACDEDVKENCVQRPDGSLELHNVQESDSGDYFCVVDLPEKYYSQHTLVVRPEVVFEGCPNSDDVFVSQVGPNTKVTAYTNPVCINADVVGIVSCDPPSGAKVGMNVTEINCTCTHPAGRVTDICMIPVPETSPCFVDDSESNLEPGPKAVCSSVTLLGVFVGIIIGIILSVLAMCFYKAYKRQSFSLLSQSGTDSHTGATRPKFTSSLKRLTDNIETQLELECRVAGHPTPTLCWYKDGKQLEPQAGYKTTFVDGVAMLTASVVNIASEGMFCCVAVNTAGDAITSCTVVVEATTKPEFTGLPKELTVDTGQPLELKCRVKGHPINTLFWYKDGKQLDPQAGYETTFSEGVAILTTSNTNKADEGMFSCVAFNSAGNTITSCKVVVEELIGSTVPPSDQATSDLVDGGSHTLEGDSGVTDSGQPFGNPNESGSTAGDVPDANTKTTALLPTCNEIRGFSVKDISSAGVRILPSNTNSLAGITVFCKHNENLALGFNQRGSSTLPKLTMDPDIGEMTISVADETAIPLSIQCLKCGTMCCTLEVFGREWSDKECEDCKNPCTGKDEGEG